MAKGKKNKVKQRSFFSYRDEDMQKAIKAVRENGLSKKLAARQFGVPRSTLIRKLSGQVPLLRKMGPPTELSKTEEEVLVTWILIMAKKGFPIHKNNLIISVKKIVEETGRETKYFNKSSLPGRSWFQGFLKRHPEIKQKHAESVSKARAAVIKDRICNWFDEILKYLKENKMEEILLDPSRIFNGDEAGFQLCPKSGKVLGPAKSNEDFYERVSSEKEQITVMASFSADGKVVPPMLIFPYKKMPKAIVESVPENWGLGRSDSGWMNSEVFYEYVGNHFIPYLKSENITRPVIFFVDGYRSHLTQQVSQLCDDHGVILISLFPNTTHIMQPADVAVFKPLKSGWVSAVRDWKFHNFPKDVTRYTFGCILRPVFDQYATAKTIQNGFRKSGLYPFNKNNVDYTKCIPNREMDNPFSNEKYSKNFQRSVLEEIEKNIEKEELCLFLETCNKGQEWTGNVESANLYKVWLSIKNKFHVTSENDITLENRSQGTSLQLLEQNILHSPDIPTLIINDSQLQTNSELPPEISVSADLHISTNNCTTLEILDTSVCGSHKDESYITPTKNSEPLPEFSTSTMWRTPTDVKSYYYESKEQEGFKVPTPFKKILVLPKTPENKTLTRKRTIYPAVVSSEKYRECYKYEANKKKETEGRKRKKAKKHYEDESDEQQKAKERGKKGKKKLFYKAKDTTLKSNILDSSSSDSSNSLIDFKYEDEDVDLSDNDELDLQVGQYVITKYEDNYYPGLILKRDHEGAEIQSMVNAGFGSWKWPLKEDILYYFKSDIVCIIAEPNVKNNRGHYTVPEMAKYE